jgi:hypothetical protein
MQKPNLNPIRLSRHVKYDVVRKGRGFIFVVLIYFSIVEQGKVVGYWCIIEEVEDLVVAI